MVAVAGRRKVHTVLVVVVIGAIFPVVVVMAVAGGIGRFALRRCGLAGEGGIGAIVPVQVATGCTILFAILNVLLVAEWFTRAASTACVLLIGVVLWRDCTAVLAQCLARLRMLKPQRGADPVRLAVLALVAGTFACGLGGLPAPCTGYDSTVYHLTLPKLYAAEEGFAPRADIVQSRYPQNLAGIRTFAWQWGGEGGVELLNWLACALLVWLLAAFADRTRPSGPARCLAVGILCASPQFMLCLYDADVEGWVALFVLCLFAFAREAGKARRRPLSLAIPALLGGCAVGIKLPCLPVVALLLLLLLVRHGRAQGHLPWRGILVTGLASGVLALFWHVVLFVVHADAYHGRVLGMGIPLLSPDRFALRHVRQALRSVARYNLPLAAFGAVAFPAWRSRMGKELVLIFGAVSVAVFVTNPWAGCFARYTFYLTPLAALGIANQLPAAWRTARFGTRATWVVAGGLLCCSLVIAQAGNVYRCARRLPVVLGLQARADYLRERVPHYDAMVEANGLVPSGGRLFLVAERSYWLDVPYVLGIERNPALHYGEMAPERFFELLGEMRVSHLLYSDDALDSTREFQAFWAAHPSLAGDPRLTLLCEESHRRATGRGQARLYAVNPVPASP